MFTFGPNTYVRPDLNRYARMAPGRGGIAPPPLPPNAQRAAPVPGAPLVAPWQGSLPPAPAPKPVLPPKETTRAQVLRISPGEGATPYGPPVYIDPGEGRVSKGRGQRVCMDPGEGIVAC